MPRRPLTEEQSRAVETLDRAVALTAAAGSGKTTVLVERYVNLISRGASPENILAITFTNEAADQIRERVLHRLAEEHLSPTLLDEVRRTPNLGTIHAFCYRVLDLYGSTLGLKGIKAVLSPFRFHALFDHAYQDWLKALPREDLSFLYDLWGHTELRGSFKNLYAKRFLFRETLSGLDPKDPVARIGELAAPLFSRLEEELTEKGEYSFDDLEHLAERILKESPEARRRLGDQFKYLLIDEFQDTSRLQWTILQNLVQGDLKRLFVVGDPKQSIYRFRNADVKVFLEATQLLVQSGGEAQNLSANFRSAPPLIGKINKIAQELFRESEVPFAPMIAGRPPERNDLGFSLEKVPGAKDQLVQEEVAKVSQRVKDLLSRGVVPTDIALLFRVSDRIPLYAEALAELGIETEAQTSQRLFCHYEILDLFHFLKTLEEPTNDFYFAAFLRSPYVKLSVAELTEIASHPGTTLYEKFFQRFPDRLGWLRKLSESRTPGLMPALTTLFSETRSFPEEGRSLLALLEPLTNEELTVSEAASRIESWKNADVLVSDREASANRKGVQLMTVHGSKGLEFSHALIVDTLRQQPRYYPTMRLSPGTPPALRFRSQGEWENTPLYEALSEENLAQELEESRRILYVALTRAKEAGYFYLPENPELIPKNTWAAWVAAVLG